MEIVKANEAHIAALAALEEACFSDALTPEMLLRQIESDSHIVLCATEDGTVLGYVSCQYVLDEGYIGSVAVGETYRRRGTALALLTALAERAKEKELSFLTLEVRESNHPARALYEKCGYETVGKRKNYYEKPIEDAILMSVYFTKEA